MSVCSNEVCALSEKKSAIKSMALVEEGVIRASPIPFTKGKMTEEGYKLMSQETSKHSENEEEVHITRKTVQESLLTSQKMYTAEVSTSSSIHRPGTPELEQIMETRREFHTYHDTNRMTPNTLSLLQKQPQSDRCLTPEIENLMDKPHGSWSPMPPACMVRPISPNHIISFPPDIPPIPATLPHPRTATPEQFQGARETVERFVDHTKHHEAHQAQLNSSRTSQFNSQQAAFSVYSQQNSGQQYTPRYDATQGFSAYKGNSGGRNVNNGSGATVHESSRGNGNPGNHGSENPGNHKESGSHVHDNPGNNRSSNPGSNGKGNPSNGSGKGRSEEKREDNPKVTEPDDSDEKCHRKSSRPDQSGPSVNEEEHSHRVFSDFGGPQISSSVQVESVTEGDIEKTSVTKSEQMQYSTCEFQSSHKSSIIQHGETIDNSSDANRGKKNSASDEPKKFSHPTFTAGEASTSEEETVTKSQVEEIIKQELNKVFNMAQTMEKTNFGQMHQQKSQQAASEKGYKKSSEQQVVKSLAASSSETFQQQSVSKLEQSGTETFNLKSTASQQHDQIQFTGQPIRTPGKLTSGLTIAPDRPFTPQPLESNFPLPHQNVPSNAPIPRTNSVSPPAIHGYIPVVGSRDSPLIQALTIAPERSYSPLPTATVTETPSFISAPKPQRSTMLEALTTASNTPFHIKSMSSEVTIDGSDSVQRKATYNQNYCSKQIQSDHKTVSSESVRQTSCSKSVCATQNLDTRNTVSFPPVTNERSAYKGPSQVQTSPFVESEISRQNIKSSHQRSLSASRAERAVTPSGLHAPNFLPYYQQNIGEIPLAHRSNSPIPHQIKAPSINPPRAQSVPRQEERRTSVKAMGEAYLQQVASVNNQQQVSSSSSSYASADAYGSSAVIKTYSYEQEHKPIDTMGYHPSPLVGKVPLAGEQVLTKCSSPLLGKLDHTKQVFKPAIPDQGNLRQAPPYFVQDKDKAVQNPWAIVKEKDERETLKSSLISSLKSQSKHSVSSIPLPKKPSLPTLPNVNKIPAFPELPKPGVTTPPDAGPGAPKGGATAGTSAPRRGRGVLNAAVPVGGRIALCASCNNQIRGPFITALGKIWCPEHFVCVNAQCRRPLQDIGFVEDPQGLYCEFCFEQYLAPSCSKCNAKVKGDCLNAIGKHFHPECFTCAYCGKLFGNSPFFLEDALPYCEADWNELFTTKCFSCGFPIEAGDRWVEALNNNYHSQCFNCTMCKKNLEGQSFFAKGGRPFCKNHAR